MTSDLKSKTLSEILENQVNDYEPFEIKAPDFYNSWRKDFFQKHLHVCCFQ